MLFSDIKIDYLEFIQNILKSKSLKCWNFYRQYLRGGFQQTLDIPIGPALFLLADLSLYVFVAGFKQSLKSGKKHSEFNFTCRYINDVLFLNNSKIFLFDIKEITDVCVNSLKDYDFVDSCSVAVSKLIADSIVSAKT